MGNSNKRKVIYYSCNSNISFDESIVEIGTHKILKDDDVMHKESTEVFAREQMHNAYRKLLSRQYENIVVLCGAGTSCGIGIDKKGQTMAQLWKSTVDKIRFEELRKFADEIGFQDMEENYTNLEQLLSRAIQYNEMIPNIQHKEMIDKLKEIIRTNCSLKLPDDAPHILFLRKITGRKLKYSRPKIFTLNYDLLFESAGAKGGYIVIDGFSFTSPRRFNGINYDYDIVSKKSHQAMNEENYVSKVFHLYKPHGSLDWEKDEKTGIVIKQFPTDNPLMIYPSSLKYEISYEQPYFEMLSRFQQETRARNTLLIIIGFSFSDKHITAMIDEALLINPSLTLLAVSPGIADIDPQKTEEYFGKLIKKSSQFKNICLVSETFKDFVQNYPESDVYSDYNEGDESHESV